MNSVTDTPTKKVNANETINLMLIAAQADRIDNLYTAAEAYLKTLAPTNGYYHRMMHLVKQKPMRLLPLAQLGGNVTKLIYQGAEMPDNIFLTPGLNSILDELKKEWDNKELFFQHNLGIRTKILLHGLTGNGKTTIAKYIAKLTGLPFIEVNSDAVIKSHMGETSANIQLVFDQIKAPCVLFWDEIDGIGKSRGGGGGRGIDTENERVVNSMLLNMDRQGRDVIFIGATNRMDIIDTAMLRRFDVKLEIGNPSEFDKKQFASHLAQYYNIDFTYRGEPINVVQFANFSEIKAFVIQMARKHVLNQIK